MTLAAAATAPIASEIGHGAPGLRDGLRPFAELLEASASEKQVFLQVRPSKLVTGWGPDSTAGVYLAAWTETWAGGLRDVVGVRTAAEELVRVETLALCRSTAGSYYFDPEETDQGLRWDGGGAWDSGSTWSAVPKLYVHLLDGSDPGATDMQVQASFWIGSVSVAQPNLGPQKLLNADFALGSGMSGGWDGFPDAPTSWAVGGPGVQPVPTTPLSGESSLAAYCAVSGLAAGAVDGLTQTGLAGVAGRLYRLSGWYKTDEALPAGLEARIRVGVAGSYLLSDGRTLTASTAGVALAATGGQVRRYAFDFVCPVDTVGLEVALLVGNTTGGTISTGAVWYDSPSLRRIWRFELAEQRLSLDSVPTIEQARPDAWFGPIARGAGTLTLTNGAGVSSLEAPLAGLDWIGQTFDLWAGGRFVQGGNEILLDDCWPVLSGILADQPEVTDAAVALPFEDLLSRLQMQVPPNTFDADIYPELAQGDQGRRRPLVFGTVEHVRPVRVAKGQGAALGLPIYEVRDMSVAVASAAATTTLYAYLDEEAAAARNAARRAEVAGLAIDPTTARVSLAADPRPILIEAGRNDALTFTVSGVGYTAPLPPGVYSWAGTGAFSLPTMLQTALNATGSPATFSLPTYDATTAGKVTIAANTAFAILTEGDPWRDASFWPALGFTSHTDYAPATSRTSDAGTQQDCDQLVVRLSSVGGYVDDASGNYTGTPGAAIARPADVLRFLLERVAGVHSSLINASTFATARTGFGADALAAHIAEESDLWAVVERIETSGRIDLVTRRGRFEMWLRDVTPTVAVQLAERDYLTWSAGYSLEDVYGVVRLAYGQDPVSGDWRTNQVTLGTSALRWGRREQRTWETYLSEDAAIAGRVARSTRLAKFAAEAAAKRRRFSVTVRGKLFALPLGAVVEMTRAKGLDVSGAPAAVRARILRKVDNVATHETVADLIEVV